MSRPAVRRAALVTIAAVSLCAACTASTDGSPQPTASGTASNPVAASSSRSSPPSAVPSTSPSPSASQSSPSAAPNTTYKRTPVRTVHGDPALIDYCAALGTSFLKRFGLRVVKQAQQTVPGCSLGLLSGRRMTYEVIGAASTLAGATRTLPRHSVTRVLGVPVIVVPARRTYGLCDRIVEERGFAFSLFAAADHDELMHIRTSCALADAAVRRLITVLHKAKQPIRPRADPSVLDTDWCRVAQATPPAAIPGFGTPHYISAAFGLSCAATTTKYQYTIAVSTLRSITGPTATVGSHRLYVSGYSTTCEFQSVQGRVPDGREVVDFYFTEATRTAGYCAQAGRVVGALLDHAGFD